MSVSRHHADWLSLVESSGPFLSLPVLLRAFPQGLDPRDPEQAKQLRLAYEEWQENPSLTAKQRAWVMHVLTQVLLHPKELLAEGQTLPPGLTATMAEYGEILRPELALLGPIGSELAGKPQLLVSLYPAEQSLDKPVAGKHWKATAGTRMMELLHATDVPLGLVTNGEEWMLVFAPRGDTTGFTSWYASLWIDEPITLRAFHSVLSTRRFFGVAPSDTLLALLKESAQDQQEVTNQLGDQVRDAVEVLIQAFDRLDQDSGRTLLKGLDEKSLYEAALTVMMRLVFLFSAEERGLLHLGEPLYDDNYAVSTLREQLQEVADHYGEEVLERRHDGWARLLATFRSVHGGVNHQDLMLPAYGGSLFDPDRYPFLEGRAQSTRWQSSAAAPLEINNRVVLHLLKSLQMLQVKVPGGGPAEALRVSFEGLNIEQIGHVYEGLLDHTAVRAKEVVLGLAASHKKPVASMTLAELEKLQHEDGAKLIEVLQEETGRSAKALENVLKSDVDTEDFHKIMVACGQDKQLAERLIQFRGLLRQDSFERLVVVLPGGIYVGQGSARRSTGTHYTPRSLTEPIVQHSLEPLVYQGPAEGLTKEQWRLRSPKEILELKVCDMAMGSGAFLVQVCRYLSERLVEAWENLEKEHPGEVLITPEGEFSQGEPSERLIPKEAVERLAIARRLVADRCLYGVDINPMAVEMAKLSIWLITVDKSRPFTFLDHALKCGDSLLGVCALTEIENYSLRPGSRQLTFATSNLFRYVEEASSKRRALESLSSNDSAQIEAKSHLHSEAEAAISKIKALADIITAFELHSSGEEEYEEQRGIDAARTEIAMQGPLPEFQAHSQGALRGHRTFHWPIQFPEVFERGGFHAFVGNPPFLWALRISIRISIPFSHFLKKRWPHARKNADLCSYFVLRALSLLRPDGTAGLVLTNTISEADTRETALDHITTNGAVIYRAITNLTWPGAASVRVSPVHFIRGRWNGEFWLDGLSVQHVSTSLEPIRTGNAALTLASNVGRCFKGSVPLGDGFFVSLDEVTSLRHSDPKNANVLFPYMTGEDLNFSPTLSPGRWVVYFRDWTLKQCEEEYLDCLELLRLRVKPERDKIIPTNNMARQRRDLWWKFTGPTVELYAAIEGKKRVLVASAVSKHHAMAFVPSTYIYSNALNIFAFDTYEHFALLQSSVHSAWALKQGSKLEDRPRYNVTDCFESFPFPMLMKNLTETGKTYNEVREKLMESRVEGLTSLYNRFHDPLEKSADVGRLRTLHVALDQAVAAAYEWAHLDLGHDFHATKQGLRFTVSETARRTILDRLLELNNRRHEEEFQSGFHRKNIKAAARKRGKKQEEKATAQHRLL